MKTELIPFHQHQVVTVRQNGQVLVAMKSICEAIGLYWSSQFKRIKRDPVLSATIVVMTMVAEDGKPREMICLPLSKLNGWLFKIDASRVAPELKEAVIDYQSHCYDLLYEHFFGKPNRQHEKFWFGKNELWVRIHELALLGLKNIEIAKQMGISAGRVARAIKRMIEVGLLDPVARIRARFKAVTAERMVQLPLCAEWGV